MKRLGLVAALLLIVGGLGACTVTISYSPPPSATPVTADASYQGSPNYSDTLAPYETVDYRVSMSNVTTALLHAEADGPVTLLVMDSSGRPIISSASSAFFASGTSALSLASVGASGGLGRAAISTTESCAGPCGLVRVADSRYYLEVTNTTGSTAGVDLYVFGTTYGDVYETRNNSRLGTTAVLSSATGSDSGALETIGDVDYWYIADSGSWDFNAASAAIDPAVYIVDGNGNQRGGPYYAGDTIPAYAGWYYEVVSASGYAGVSDQSEYFFTNFQ